MIIILISQSGTCSPKLWNKGGTRGNWLVGCRGSGALSLGRGAGRGPAGGAEWLPRGPKLKWQLRGRGGGGGGGNFCWQPRGRVWGGIGRLGGLKGAATWNYPLGPLVEGTRGHSHESAPPLPLCTLLVSTTSSFTTHLPVLLTWKGNNSWGLVCPQCGKCYPSELSLIRHLKYTCCKEAKFKCSCCDYRSCRKANVVKHFNETHDPNPVIYGCDICSYTGVHYGVGGFGGLFKCGLCFRSYRSEGSLERHVRYTCGQGANFQCSICDYKSYRRNNVEKHYTVAHDPCAVLHRCHHCSYASKQKGHLKRHYYLKHRQQPPVLS
ncbi:hypothetical protein AAG570_013972 [Ranatra chinensis]|uniref:C2H2-type domain-containing protein n=1 Tax=Ranatra chinensis TaxID=642074 RepID=A0ABD0YDR1_9HEMI